jgi:hypothetical protein
MHTARKNGSREVRGVHPLLDSQCFGCDSSPRSFLCPVPMGSCSGSGVRVNTAVRGVSYGAVHKVCEALQIALKTEEVGSVNKRKRIGSRRGLRHLILSPQCH